MTFGGVVGEAEVVIRANTAGFATELKAQTDPALAGLAGQSAIAGETSGAAMTGGMSRETALLGQDATLALGTQTKKMEGLASDFKSKFSKTLQGFGVPASLATAPKFAVLAGAAIAAVSVKMAADMQKATTSIANSAGISVKAATSIGDAFVATGGKSEFSGIKQAQAFALVAGQLKATQGTALSTVDSLTFMNTATTLATAKQIDLGTATSTLAGVMQAFQINVHGAADASNVLFNASNATGQSIDSLAAGVERVRSRLGTMAPPLKDLTALIVDFTKQGITGRGALTGLQGSYTALAGAATGTTKANILAKTMLADYGVQVVDANGKLVSMAKVIETLSPKYATMNQAQQLQTSTLIFGASAAKQMTSIIDAGTGSYVKATAEVTKHNAVQLAAELQAKTLSGQWKTLTADVSDLAVQLGSVLVPAFSGLEHIILPVIDGVVKLVGWFEKGSAPAIAIAGVIGAVLVPAILDIGKKAIVSASESVVSFITMGRGIQGFGATAVTSAETANVATQSVATTAATTAGEVAAAVDREAAAVTAATTEIQGSFGLLTTAFIGDGAEIQGAFVGIDGAAIGTADTIVAADRTIGAANAVAGASFTAMIPLIGAVALAALALKPVVTNAINSASNSMFGTTTTSTQFQAKFDAQINAAKGNTAKIAQLNKDAEKAAKIFGFAYTPYEGKGVATTGVGFSKEGSRKTGMGVWQPGQSTVGKDQFIAPPDSTAAKAAEKAKKAAEALAKKAAAAAKKVETAAVHATSTLASEIDAAIKLPANQQVGYLKALGLSSTKAAQVLHDAILPFGEAIKALEKAGLTAAEAVKIAEDERKIQATAAKKAIKKAVKGTSTTGAGNISGISVNGVPVAGLSAAGLVCPPGTTSTAAAATTTGSTASGPSAPGGTAVTITISPGAIVINPSPGNDGASLVATQGMVDQMLKELVTELRGGVLTTGPVHQ